MTYFLGLDIGTSAVKAALVDERGRVKGAVSVAHPLLTPQPGWAEQRPEDWWKSTVKAVRSLLATTRVAPKRIVSVGILEHEPVDIYVNPTYLPPVTEERNDGGDRRRRFNGRCGLEPSRGDF